MIPSNSIPVKYVFCQRKWDSQRQQEWDYWGVLSVNVVGNNKGATHYRVAPNYLPNNISYVHGSYKVVSMLFIAKAVLK